MTDKIINQIEASIHLSDGRIINGSFDPSHKTISFNDFYDMSNRLKLDKVNEDESVIISYIFDTDYLPRRFPLDKERPLIIKDYLRIEEKDEYVEIVIRII